MKENGIQRNSSFELLRIVAILFVVVHHLVILGADTVGYVSPYSIESQGIFGVVVNSFVIVGVNLFVLITGWFGIKLKWRSIVRLLIDCMVFGFISYGILTVISEHTFHLKEFIRSGFFTSNWFVRAYMILLLASPILETSLKDASNKTLLWWILLLSVLNLYFGYYLQQLNTNGYNALQFIWLYYIARYLRLSHDEKWNKEFSRDGLVIYIFLSILLALIFLWMSYKGHTIGSLRWFSYNNPLLMLSSISLFMWFSCKSITSKVVNTVASGVFGVFLLHTTPFFVPFMNAYTHNVYEQYGYTGVFLEALLIIAGSLTISLLVNKLTNPVINLLSRLCNRCTNDVVRLQCGLLYKLTKSQASQER